MAPHRPMFELQQPSSPCGRSLALHERHLRRLFLIAYDATCAPRVLAADVPLLGGAMDNVLPFVQTLSFLCHFENKRSLISQLCQEGKPVLGDKREYSGKEEPQTKSTLDRPNVIVACILPSLLPVQHGQSGHVVTIYLLHLATDFAFDAPREFATQGLVVAEGTEELAVRLEQLLTEVAAVFGAPDFLSVASSCTHMPPALHVIGGAEQRMNVLQYLVHGVAEALRLAIDPTDGAPGALSQSGLQAAKEGEEDIIHLPVPKAATRLLRLTADPAHGAPVSLLPPAGLRGAVEDEEELVRRLEKQRATAAVGDGQRDVGAIVRRLHQDVE